MTPVRRIDSPAPAVILPSNTTPRGTTDIQPTPTMRYPRLIEIAEAAALIGPEREFRAGLDIVMAGLTAS